MVFHYRVIIPSQYPLLENSNLFVKGRITHALTVTCSHPVLAVPHLPMTIILLFFCCFFFVFILIQSP